MFPKSVIVNYDSLVGIGGSSYNSKFNKKTPDIHDSKPNWILKDKPCVMLLNTKEKIKLNWMTV